MGTAKHKFQKLVFNPANQNLVDFLDELQKLAKDAFGIAARAIIEKFVMTDQRRLDQRRLNFHQSQKFSDSNLMRLI